MDKLLRDKKAITIFVAPAFLLFTFILFIPRQLITFKEFMEGIGIGVRSMVGAFIILILAWSISGVCRELLNTGVYVGDLVANSSIKLFLCTRIN